jgi:hypothetical protein
MSLAEKAPTASNVGRWADIFFTDLFEHKIIESTRGLL